MSTRPYNLLFVRFWVYCCFCCVFCWQPKGIFLFKVLGPRDGKSFVEELQAVQATWSESCPGYLVLGFAFQVVTMAALRISRLQRWRTAEKIIYLPHGDSVGNLVFVGLMVFVWVGQEFIGEPKLGHKHRRCLLGEVVPRVIVGPGLMLYSRHPTLELPGTLLRWCNIISLLVVGHFYIHA